MPCASNDHTAPQWMFFSFSTSLQFDIRASYLLHHIPCLHYALSMKNHEPTIPQQIHSNLMKVYAVQHGELFEAFKQCVLDVLHLSSLK